MDVPTRNNRARNWRAAVAVLVGLLSVACLPAGIGIARYTDVELIQAGWAVIPGLLLGWWTVSLARRARHRTERTIGRVGGRRTTRIGGLLGALGVYLALSGALALAVYLLLDYLSA